MTTRIVLWGSLVGCICLAPLLAQEESAVQASGLSAEVVIAGDVQNREPVNPAESFSIDTEKVAGWTKISGASQPTEVTHVWSYNGQMVREIKLPVQSSSFRTWSRKTVQGMAGSWKLEVKDAGGIVIGEKTFEVRAQEAEAPPQTSQ